MRLYQISPRPKRPLIRDSDRQYLSAIASVEGDVTIPKIQEQLRAKFNLEVVSDTVWQRLNKLTGAKLIRRVNGMEVHRIAKAGRPHQCYKLTVAGAREIEHERAS